MTDIDTKITTNRQPEYLSIDYEDMLVVFCFGRGSELRKFSLPIKAYSHSHSVAVAEDDIKKLCLEENHSLADFEAIRLGIKAFLRDHQVYVVNDYEYRVRREDVLWEIATRVIKGERVPKTENAQKSEAA